MGDSSSAGCGAARGRVDDCKWSTCARGCFEVDAGDVDGGNGALYDACIAEAESGLCASYVAAVNSACPSSSPVYPTCYGTGLTKEEFQDQLGAIFCAAGADGGSAADAGIDGD
jgi:hypothetical protein